MFLQNLIIIQFNVEEIGATLHDSKQHGLQTLAVNTLAQILALQPG